MCLTTLAKFRVRKDPKTKQYVGWKIVRKLPFGFTSIYFSTYREYKERIWYECGTRSEIRSANDTDKYPSGFHCYAKKKDAIIEKAIATVWMTSDTVIVKKVFLKEILATGLQEDKQCIVSQEMYII
jgi:hypothetical protein